MEMLILVHSPRSQNEDRRRDGDISLDIVRFEILIYHQLNRGLPPSIWCIIECIIISKLGKSQSVIFVKVPKNHPLVKYDDLVDEGVTTLEALLALCASSNISRYVELSSNE